MIKIPLALVAVLAMTGMLQAQESSTTAPSNQAQDNSTTSPGKKSKKSVPTEEEIVQLNPFEVSTTSAQGYGANSSTVATGFNRDLQHTPLTINIVTDEFIRDAGLRSYGEVSDYLPNTYVVSDPYGLGSTSIIRGQGTSYYAQDGNRFYTEPILSAGSRVDVIKGPATLFFGRAQPGGIFDFSTRPPSPRAETTVGAGYGSYGLANFDLGSQGPIVAGRNGRLVDYRLDVNLQDGGAFTDYSHDRYQQLRGVVGMQPFQSLTFRFSYEYSWRDQAGAVGVVPVLSPQYYSDYKNPRPEEIAWAQAAGRAGAGATAAQATTWLQNRWRENDSAWDNDVLATYGGVLKPVRRIGVDENQSPYGWRWNYAGTNSYAQKIVHQFGGESTWDVLPDHIAFKVSWYAYNLMRRRLDINLPTLWADGVFRFSNPNSVVYRNNDNTFTATALFNYDLGPTSQTTNLGVVRFKDYYTQSNGLYFGLDQAPGVGTNDIRMSGGGIVTPGWNPAAPSYYDISQYVKTPAAATAFLLQDRNYENAYYASHIAEFFDHRLGILAGGRYQRYDNKRVFSLYPDQIPYDVGAKVWTLGLSWQITPQMAYFMNESTSFEPNGGSIVGGPGAKPAEQQNNPAPPVFGREYEAGFKYDLNEKIAFSASYFNLIRDNDFKTVDTQRTANDPRNTDGNPNDQVTWYVIGGERLSRGVDLQTNYRPTANWQGLFTVGWLPVAKITKNIAQLVPTKLPDGIVAIDPNVDNAMGLRQVNSPVLKIATWNDYLIPSGFLRNLSVGLGYIYTSKAALTANRTTPEYAPAYSTIRVAASYPVNVFGRIVDAQVVVEDLFNKHYYRGANRAEPRTIRLNLYTKF